MWTYRMTSLIGSLAARKAFAGTLEVQVVKSVASLFHDLANSVIMQTSKSCEESEPHALRSTHHIEFCD